MILSQALNNAALKNSSQAAILDLGKTINFGELRKRVGQLSYLHQVEIGAGKRVAFLSQNNTAVVQSFLAFSNLGIASIFIDPKESNDEILQVLKDLEISHIAISGDQKSRINDLMRTSGISLNVIEIEKKKGGEYDPSYSPPPERALKETDQILILRTDDQSVPTKYIFFNHKQIYTAVISIRRFYQLRETDRFFTTMNWAHPFALIHGMLLPILNTACCAIDPQLPTGEEFVEYLAKQHINRFVDSGKYFFQLLALCKTHKYMLPGVKSITVGVGTLPMGLWRTFSLLKVPVLQCYGRPENLWTIAMQSLENPEQSQSLHCLNGYKYKVLDSAGDELPTENNPMGPLAICGESVMHAYYHPNKALVEKASKQKIRGTWLYTGDIASLSGNANEGFKLEFLGKSDEVIQRGDIYVNADRIDSVAKELPGVLDAAGFILYRESGPCFACAVIKQNPLLKEYELLLQLQSRLDATCQPTDLFFVDEIPRDAFDNVRRKSLQLKFS